MRSAVRSEKLGQVAAEFDCGAQHPARRDGRLGRRRHRARGDPPADHRRRRGGPPGLTDDAADTARYAARRGERHDAGCGGAVVHPPMCRVSRMRGCATTSGRRGRATRRQACGRCAAARRRTRGTGRRARAGGRGRAGSRWSSSTRTHGTVPTAVVMSTAKTSESGPARRLPSHTAAPLAAAGAAAAREARRRLCITASCSWAAGPESLGPDASRVVARRRRGGWPRPRRNPSGRRRSRWARRRRPTPPGRGRRHAGGRPPARRRRAPGG